MNLRERPVRQIVYYAQRNIALWQEKLISAMAQENAVPNIVIFTINREETQVVAVGR